MEGFFFLLKSLLILDIVKITCASSLEESYAEDTDTTKKMTSEKKCYTGIYKPLGGKTYPVHAAYLTSLNRCPVFKT